MIDIEKTATEKYNDIYNSIIAEAELHNLTDSNLQLFINATLRNVLLDQIKLTLIAQNKLHRNDTENLQERDEEILKEFIRGTSQKNLAKQNKISSAMVNKILHKTAKRILNLNGEAECYTSSALVKKYRKQLVQLFFVKKHYSIS